MTKVTYITLLIKIIPLLALSLFAKEPYSINIFPFSTKLKVFYKVDKNRNGYDITYIFKNDSKTPLELPNIKIGYIFLNPKKYIYVLNTANSLNMQRRAISKIIYINGSKELYYPISYSPIIAAGDEKNAFCACVLTNFLKDNWAIGGKIEKEKKGYVFIFTNENKKRVKPNESFKIKIAFRKTKRDKWIEGIKPYKEYFDKTFQKDYPKKDTKKILGVEFSYIGAARDKGNERGYNYIIRADLYGLDGKNPRYNKSFIKALLEKMKKEGFKKVMFWALSGEYFKNCQKRHCKDTNYPPQFMENFPKKIEKSINKLKILKKYGIDYGFWWGRSTKIPVKGDQVLKPNQWNPQKTIPLNPLNKEHLNFAIRQMDFAKRIGATQIGLDAYMAIDSKFQLKWIKFLKKRYPDIKFWIEGSVTDYLHTKASLFLQPKNPFFNPLREKISKPPVLANYLNPNAEIILYLPGERNISYIKKVQNLGFTPLIVFNNSNVFE